MQKIIKNNRVATALQINPNVQIAVLRSIGIGFAFFVIIYLFLLGSTIVNVVERKSLEAEAHAITNEIGELELNYLQLSGTVNRELSKNMGFKEVNQNFATRKSFTLNPKEFAKNEI